MTYNHNSWQMLQCRTRSARLPAAVREGPREKGNRVYSPAGSRLSKLSLKTVSFQGLFFVERGLAGFPQFGKKFYIKFTLPRQKARKKIDPGISTFFFLNKVFENITDNNTDLTAALYTYIELL